MNLPQNERPARRAGMVLLFALFAAFLCGALYFRDAAVQFSAPARRSSLFDPAGGRVTAPQAPEEDAGSQLVWFDRTGNQVGTLGDQQFFLDLSLSPDRKWASVSVPNPGDTTGFARDIWLYNVASGEGKRFTDGPAFARTSIWSPDGMRIAYASAQKVSSDGRRHYNLYVKNLSGGSEQALAEDDQDKFPDSWSPDGRFIIYLSNDHDLFVLPLFGDRRPYPFLQSNVIHTEAQFSPDGRWVAYLSDEASPGDVYVTSFPDARKTFRVSTAGGGQPRWSRDGSEIFYIGPGNWLISVAVNGKGDTFEVGAAKPLFQTRFRGNPWEYDVSADGQRFLINTAADQVPRGTVLARLESRTAGTRE